MNKFTDKLWYYFKDSLMTYSYILVGGILGFILMFMTNSGSISGLVCSILSVINIALYVIVARNIFYKTGEEAMRAKHGNDLERRHMLETRTYHEIDKVNEFSYKKIALFASITVIPLVILIIIFTIVFLCGGNYIGLDMVIKFIYSSIYSFFYGISQTASVYFTLLGLIIYPVPVVVGYIQGAYKAKSEYDQAEKIKQKIHGEQN